MAQHTTATASAIKNDQKREKYFSKRIAERNASSHCRCSAPRLPPRARTRDRVGGNRPTCRTLLATWRQHRRAGNGILSERSPSGEMNDPVVGLVNSQTGHPSRCRRSCMGNRPRASVSRTDNPTTHENTARPDRIVRSLYENLAIRAAKPSDQKQPTLGGVELSSSIQICVVIAVPECRRGGAPPRHRRPGAPSPSRRSGSPSPPRTRPGDRGRSCARFHGGT